MTKKALIPTAAAVLLGMGGLALLLSLMPRKWDSETHPRLENHNAFGTAEDDIRWGEPVRGLRVGVIVDYANAFVLPGQQVGVGLCLENVSGELVTVDQYCSVALRPRRRDGAQLEDVPMVGTKKEVFHVAGLVQTNLKPGDRADFGLVYPMLTKGFLHVGNDSYGPFLAGEYVLSGQIKITLRTEPGARGEQIELASGTASLGIRDIDWGPAHDGVQIALAEFRDRFPERDAPVFALVCRNSGEKRVQLAGGFELIQCVTVTKPDGKAASFRGGPRVPGEGSVLFDLKPDEIQIQAHDFRWSDVKESTPGEYAFSVSTVFFADEKLSPVYTTNNLKLKRPE